MRTLYLFALLLIGGVQTAHAAQAETPQPRCIAPARPGGGYDLTCRIAKLGLDEARALPARLQIDYRPGGIGAVRQRDVDIRACLEQRSGGGHE